MSQPALSLVRGDGHRSEVSLGLAVAIVRSAERHFDHASADLIVAPEEGPEQEAARRSFDAAAERLVAALNRRDRLIAEMGGERWLWVASGGAGG